MLTATLDTSCALNFLGADDEPSDALVDGIAAAIAGRLHIRVTEEAYAEVSRAADEGRRRERMTRLRAFGRVTVPTDRRDERDSRASEFEALLFPSAQPGSRTSDHNRRDCLQLAAHEVVGRDLFVTLDRKLLRRVNSTPGVEVAAVAPEDLLERLEDERRAGRLPSAPAIAVRDAVPDRDEADVRKVLAPLVDDYPGFSGWLNKALEREGTGQSRIRLGLAEGKVGAVALSTRKDRRVVKLSAFYVADWARDAGLGQHLLWSEIRSWAQATVEKVYVTVSSRHAELIEFFRGFGFLIEGVSARRYQNDTAEIVLGKHVIRRCVTDRDLDGFARDVASRIFAVPPSVEAPASTWAIAPQATHPKFEWRGAGAEAQLVALNGQRTMRSWDILALETLLHPARFALRDRPALVVPIQPRWANAMLDHPEQQLPLVAEGGSDKLLLRSENAYYCFPTALQTAIRGTPIVFLVTGGRGLVGEARIIDSVVAEPEELFARFGGLGIYGIEQIRGHARKDGDLAGHALAMHFGFYVPFKRPVTRQQMDRELQRTLQVQTITPIAGHEFERLRRIGGLSW